MRESARTTGRVARPRRRTAAIVLGVVALVAATACEGAIYVHVDVARDGAGVARLTRSDLLAGAADANSAAMCAAGTVTPSADPKADYDLETIAAADELVGRAPLDPGITDPVARNDAATQAVWAGWAGDPTLVDADWDDIGVGEVECADGNLYLTAALTDRPTMPATGTWSSIQHPATAITELVGLEYGTAVDHQGNTVDLLLDLYLPPASGADRPLVIIVHGGGFQTGSRTTFATTARDYARRGFVAASIDYRLNPTMGANPPLEVYVQAVLNATDDGMESVRWLRANAATYDIDTSRIAMLGSSAGGGIALLVSVLDDPTPGGPLAAHSPRVDAAVSTGATLALGLGLVTFDAADSPYLMLHYETDTTTGATDDDAQATCDALRVVGGTCDVVIQPGSGHTTSISGSGAWWTPEIGPFLWEHLDLG